MGNYIELRNTAKRIAENLVFAHEISQVERLGLADVLYQCMKIGYREAKKEEKENVE